MILTSLFFSRYIYPLVGDGEHLYEITIQDYRFRIKIPYMYAVLLLWFYLSVVSVNKISLLFLYNEAHHQAYTKDGPFIEIFKNDVERVQISHYTILVFLVVYNFYLYRYSYYFLGIHIALYFLSQRMECIKPFLFHYCSIAMMDGRRVLNATKLRIRTLYTSWRGRQTVSNQKTE